MLVGLGVHSDITSGRLNILAQNIGAWRVATSNFYMTPLNRLFLDAQGKRGKPRLTVRSVNRTNEGKQVRFRLFTATHITLTFPARVVETTVKVNKKDGIRLAHWLLDECSK